MIGCEIEADPVVLALPLFAWRGLAWRLLPIREGTDEGGGSVSQPAVQLRRFL